MLPVPRKQTERFLLIESSKKFYLWKQKCMAEMRIISSHCWSWLSINHGSLVSTPSFGENIRQEELVHFYADLEEADGNIWQEQQK